MIEEKIILTKSELKNFINEGIRAGISLGESAVYKDDDYWKKERVAFQNFLEVLTTREKLIFEYE